MTEQCCARAYHTDESEHAHPHAHEHTHAHDHAHKHDHTHDEAGCCRQDSREHAQASMAAARCGCGHDHSMHAHDAGVALPSCGCGHAHGEGEAQGWRSWLGIIIAAVFFAVGLLLPEQLAVPRIVVLLAAYVAAGFPVLREAAGNIRRGQVFDENFLMSVASLGAIAIGDYAEAVAVMLFFRVGERFEDRAVAKSRRSISALMDIRPDTAHLLRDGALVTVSPEQVRVNDTIVIQPGERVPLDARLVEGSSALDTSALTGEAVPRSVRPGDELLSGCVNGSGLLTAVVTREYSESTVSRVLDMVEHAAAAKSRVANFITRFARVYTPAVVAAAALLAIVPPLVAGQAFSIWFTRAMTLLVISCPCALVISVPLSFFGGIGGASRAGILVKGGNYLDALAHTEIAVFDKTGTLTKGEFAVREISAADGDSAALLELAAHAEAYSTHPLALALRRAFAGEIVRERVQDVQEIAGQGVSARVGGKHVLAGNARLLTAAGINLPAQYPGTVVYVAADGVYRGCIAIGDSLKDDARQAIASLRSLGVKRCVMLSGDNRAAAEAVAAELGLDEVRAELLPGDKVRALEELLAQCSPKGKLLYAGDGVNDAPVLARADIGVAMGALGADAAIEAADLVIMTDQPLKIAQGMRIARRTMMIVRQNIAFALGVKAVVLVLGACGLATMWAAVFADVGVALLAILNAMRTLRIPE